VGSQGTQRGREQSRIDPAGERDVRRPPPDREMPRSIDVAGVWVRVGVGVVGGDGGPNSGDGLSVDGTDAIGTDSTNALAATDPASAVDGQFLADGTLLKPVVVNASMTDASSTLRSYKVRAGDTLTGIARKMGVSMMTIWWANKLKSKNALHIGQVLIIPPVDGLVTTVNAGDTLESIAKAHNLSADEIASYNHLAERTLVLGQVLMLPGARGAAIPTPKPTKRPVAQVPTSHPTTNSGAGSSNSGGGGGSTPKPQPPSYSGGALAWPVPGGHISQYYSYGHPALDIAAPMGTPIVAAAGGTVTYAGWKNNDGGYQVWISHGNNLYTTYNHMSSVGVSVGQHVGRGQFVGRVGMTGHATGPHCHFEVWRGPIWSGGTRVNPLGYL